MKEVEITNWKLKEVLSEIEIIAKDSDNYFKHVSEKLSLPLNTSSSINRENTHINWSKFPSHYKFYSDGEGEEMINMKAFRNSKLSQKSKVIINYGHNEPAVLINTEIFIDEWQDFFASTQWETLVFSEDLELIMEVSRDFYVHSNFKIK